MKTNKPLKYLLLLLIGLFLQPVLLYANDFYSPEDVEKAAGRLDRIIEQNARNDAAGMSHLNTYVFSLADEKSEEKLLYRRGTDYVGADTRASLNYKLQTLAKDHQIYVYVALDGLRLSVEKETEQTSGQSFREEIKAYYREIYEESKLGKGGDDYTALLGYSPVERYFIHNLESLSEKDKLKFSLFTAKYFGEGFRRVEQKVRDFSINYNPKRRDNLDSIIYYTVDTIETLFKDHRYREIPCYKLYQAYVKAEHPLVTDKNNYFYLLAKNNPCMLKGAREWGPLHFKSEWMQELEMVVSGALYASLGPAVIEIAFPVLLEAAGSWGVSKLKDASVGVTMDIVFQMLIVYYFELEEANRNWDNVTDRIDYWQAGASGVEAMFDNIAVSAAISCLQDGNFDEGEFRENFEMKECVKGAMSSLIIDGVLNTGPAYKKLKTLAESNPDRFVQSLFLMMDHALQEKIIQPTQLKEICKRFGIPETTLIKYFKNADQFIEAFHALADQKAVNLYKKTNNVFEVAGVYAVYGTSYVLKKLKTGTAFEQLAQKGYFDEFKQMLPDDKQIDIDALSQDKYEEVVAVFGKIKSKHPGKSIDELADNFDKLTNYYSPEQLKPWLDNGVDAYQLQHVFENLLADATTDKKASVLSLLSDWDADTFSKFAGDLTPGSDFVEALRGDLGLLGSWKVLSDGGVDDLIKRNPEALEIINKYRNTVDSDLSKLTDKFRNADNKEDALSDVITEVRRKARQSPGASTGNGIIIEGKWMRGTDSNIGLFPKRIADKLKNKQFKDFNEFRSEFWKTVADDPILFSQFGRASKSEMLKGNAPFALQTQQVGGRIKYELHHKTPIHDGGGVYDIDNLVIVTPRYHKEILDPAYHFKK